MKKALLFVREKLENVAKKATPMLVAVAAITGSVLPVYAGNIEGANGAGSGGGGNSTSTLESTLGKVVGVVFDLFRYIGIVLALWGVGSLVMAFKNEDADSKSRAIMSLVVGLVLMFLETVAKPILDAANIPVG